MKNELTAKRLQLAMTNNQIKAQELADRSGLNKASISQYINGTHAPSNISAGKMANILNVDPVWLMGFDVPMIKEGSDTKSLSSDEDMLIRKYRLLSVDNKDRLLRYADGLLVTQEEDEVLRKVAAQREKEA